MNINRLRYGVLLVAGIAMTGFTGCVNEDYDLDKEIDTTVKLGESLSLPIKKVSKIKFCDILDIDANDNLDTVKTTDTELLKIMKAGDLYMHVQSDNDNHNSFQTEEMTFNLNNSETVMSSPITSDVKEFTIKTALNAETNDIAYEVRDLEFVECSDLTYSIELGYQNIFATSNTITVKDLKITLPPSLELKAATNNEYTMDGNTAKYTPIDILDGSTRTVKLHIGRINVAKGQFTPAQDENGGGKLKINDEVEINGNISGLDGVAQLKITGTPKAQSDIHVLLAKGVFRNKKSAKQVATFEVGDLPDFLSNDENKLFIGCPLVKFGVMNDVMEHPIEVLDITNISLTAEYAKGEPETITIDTLNIKEVEEYINYKKTQVFYSTLVGEKKYEGKGFLGETPIEKNIICSKDGKIAQKFTVTLQDAEIAGTIIINHPYEMTYELTAPLWFKDETKIEYEDKLDGWNDDVQDIDLKNDTAQIAIVAEAVSTLPFDFTIKSDDLYFIDAEGNKIVGLTATIKEGETIKANKTTNLQILVNSNNLEEHLKKLDGMNIHFQVSVVDGNNPINNTDHTIQFQNLNIRFSGPILKL